MESTIHTASPSPTRSEVLSHSGSKPVSPWSEPDTNLKAAYGNGTKELKLHETESGCIPIPVKRLDTSKIKSEVIMAQRLSRREQQNLHFIIQRYRLLCNRMVEVAKNLDSQVFLITSALAEEGKTLVTANLAFALSGIENKRTLLIDLDLRRYSMHALLGLSDTDGDEHFLQAEDWHDSLWSIRPGLDALLATSPVDRPDELLYRSAMVDLLSAARREYDYILIDSAPLLLAADTHAMLPIIDQAMLVVRADHTPIACSQDALKILGDKAVGCILNDVKRLKYEDYYNGYYGADKKL